MEIPSILEQRESELLSQQDINNLVNAFDDAYISLNVFGQFNLKLSPGDLDNSNQAKSRSEKLTWMLQRWKERRGECAVLGEITKILDEADLIATKHRFWNFYKDENTAKRFNDSLQKLQDFIESLAACPITEQEWSTLVLKLNVRKAECDEINEKHPHDKIMQRLAIIGKWIEKMGYLEANITILQDRLKKAKLRRVIHKINDGSEMDSLPMNAPFVHFLEDELDNIFLKLNEEQQENVLRHLQSKDIDEAFYNIRRKGNEGFHSFAQILRKQCSNHDKMISLFNNEDSRRLFSLHFLCTKVPHFMESQEYKEMTQQIDSENFLEVFGLPGSGKSQCASAYAVEFIEKHPVSVVWFLDCKSESVIEDSIHGLRKALLDANVCKNNKHKNEIIRELAIDIKNSDMYVLLVLEDVSSKIKNTDKLFKFLNYLEQFVAQSRIFLLATVRNSNIMPRFFSSKRISGFTDEEALDYLLNNHLQEDQEEKEAAKEIVKSYSNLPLGIAPAKAYCEENDLSYTDYLKAMKEEVEAMKLIESWIDENITVDKSIFAAMVLALSSLKVSIVSIDLYDIFSHAIYFHHEKIPMQLFKHLIIQPDLLSEEKHQPVSDVYCKIAIKRLQKQLQQSSLGVVDAKSNKDDFASTISTHLVVILALKHNTKGKDTPKKVPNLLNALHALSCYFQKDNRLKFQHQMLVTLMPHVTSALSYVDALKKDSVLGPDAMLEAILVIRLHEAKGFACTQADAASEACEPLKTAYEQLIRLLCNSENITENDLEDRIKLQISSNDDECKARAQLLTRYCESAVNKIPQQVFTHLALTVNINQEDIDILKRNSGGKKLHKDVIVNQPLTANALEWLRNNNLAISEANLKKTYLAELLASIAYTRGRLMFYKGFDGNKDEHINYLNLSFAITKEVYNQTNVLLLHHLLADTNGLLYLKLNNGNYEDAYRSYKSYLIAEKRYYEHGVLKEDGKTDYNQMRCYKQMITANHRILENSGAEATDDLFEVCRNLKKLVQDHPQYAKTAVNSLLVAGDFAQFGKKYSLAINIFRAVLDRLKDEEAKHQQNFFHATEGFCNSSLKFFEQKYCEESKNSLNEAKQRCEKARVLVPRSQNVSKMKELADKIDDSFRKMEEVKKRKTS